MKKVIQLCYFVAFTALLATALGSVGTAQEMAPELPSDFEWVEQLTFQETPLRGRRSLNQGDQPQETVEVRFSAWGRDFEVVLQPAELFADRARNIWMEADGARRQEAPEAIFLSGRLRDEPGSQVRFSLLGEELEGFLLSDEDAFFLEPARRYFPGAGPGPMVAYRLGALGADWVASQCALSSLEGDSSQDLLETEIPDDGPAGTDPAMRSLLDEIRTLDGGGSREVEIRLVADSFYYLRYGSGTANRIQSTIHQINAIFEREIGLSFRITETRVWTSREQDGVSATTDADDLIDQFSSSEHVAGNDLAHLFTGRHLNGPVGIARIGGVCNTNHATAITQDLTNTSQRIVLTAHEIGHNLGARHDGTGSCQEAPSGFIMWPIVDSSAKGFSGCSLGSIDRRLERAQCLEPEAGDPLPAPEVLGPGGSVMESAPLFQWQPVEGSQSYRLEVYDDSQAQLVLNQDVGFESFRPDGPLSRRHNYRWRISAADSRGSGEWSSWHDFSILALAAPDAMAPQGLIRTDQPEFSWKASHGAVSYLLEIVNEETDEYSTLNTKKLEFQPASSLEGSRFRWRVSALDEEGTPSPSPWLRFVYRDPRAPALPRIRP
ncbi:MAG TPA: M12 family metallo-peptidase [Acidobacteriota bacterium]|nr:M12 family metallo-peptidase [Acidobacteriota bacterium]